MPALFFNPLLWAYMGLGVLFFFAWMKSSWEEIIRHERATPLPPKMARTMTFVWLTFVLLMATVGWLPVLVYDALAEIFPDAPESGSAGVDTENETEL